MRAIARGKGGNKEAGRTCGEREGEREREREAARDERSYASCTIRALWRIQSAQRRSISRNAAIDYHGPAYRYYRRTQGRAAQNRARRARDSDRKRERERERERGEREREIQGEQEKEKEKASGDAHTLDRVQGCPLSTALRYPGHTRTRGPTNDIGSSIILVPRISSARYCHRERLMFRPGSSPPLFYPVSPSASSFFSAYSSFFQPSLVL